VGPERLARFERGCVFPSPVHSCIIAGDQGMNKILVSYRREDSAAYAGRLADRLRQHFGADNVFVDIDTIQPGQDFVESIDASVGSCDALVAVIGKTWLSGSDTTGRRRLDNPDDFVRREIATALRRGVAVIPALVGGATMPVASDLPDDLSTLVRRQALEITDTRFHHDADRLIKALSAVTRRPKTLTDRLPRPQWKSTTWGWIGVATVLILASLAYWRFYIVGAENGRHPAPVVIDTPESHASNAPQPMQPGRTYKVRLESNRETYFRVSRALTDARLVMDVQCTPGVCFNLKTDVTILDGEGAMIANHAIQINLYNQLGAREIAVVSLKQPSPIQIKLLNPTTEPVDHWLTVMTADSTELVPFFGAPDVRTIRVGDSASGALETNGGTGYAVLLNKGDYTVTLDLGDAGRASRFHMNGYVALIPAAGGTEVVPCRISEYNTVSSRATGTLSIKSDGLYYVRVQVQGDAVQYLVKLARR
jgi:hypothetical protein